MANSGFTCIYLVCMNFSLINVAVNWSKNQNCDHDETCYHYSTRNNLIHSRNKYILPQRTLPVFLYTKLLLILLNSQVVGERRSKRPHHCLFSINISKHYTQLTTLCYVKEFRSMFLFKSVKHQCKFLLKASTCISIS